MALSSLPCARAIMDGLMGQCGLKDEDGDQDVTLEEIAAMPKGYPQAWRDAYDAYALKGKIVGAEVPVSSPAIIETFFVQMMSGRWRTADEVFYEFGLMFATYWDTVFVGGPQAGGPPMHGGIKIVDVYNDAASKQPAFEAAIRAHVRRLGSMQTKPYFKEFIDDIEKVVKTITWYIVELMAGPPMEEKIFPEKIS